MYEYSKQKEIRIFIEEISLIMRKKTYLLRSLNIANENVTCVQIYSSIITYKWTFGDLN